MLHIQDPTQSIADNPGIVYFIILRSWVLVIYDLPVLINQPKQPKELQEEKYVAASHTSLISLVGITLNSLALERCVTNIKSVRYG